MFIKSILCFVFIGATSVQSYTYKTGSPCPDIFHYAIRGDGRGVYGVVNLEIPRHTQKINLEVVISIPPTKRYHYVAHKKNGKIILKTPLSSVNHNIESGQPITYKLIFPQQELLPIVTAISVNGKYICIRPSVRGADGTTAIIRHQLNLSQENIYYSNFHGKRYFNSGL